MSTCQGAPAPHEDCQHGPSCDWQPSDARKTLTTLAMLGRGLPAPVTGNRAERRAAARRKR